MSKLSIVIVNWNGWELLDGCLRSLAANGASERCQTIVVDNASSDDSVSLLRDKFPWVELVSSPTNVGFSAGNNLGIERATGDWIMLLNNDTLVPNNWINQIYEILATISPKDVLGIQLHNPDGSLQPSHGNFPSLSRIFLNISMLDRVTPGHGGKRAYIVTHPAQYKVKHQVDWVSGACLIAHRQAFDQVGGLDSGYFMYVEEVDWCRRAQDKGYCVWYTPEAHLTHIHSGSTKNRIGKVVSTYRSLFRYFEKHESGYTCAMLRIVLGLATMIKLGASLLAWIMRVRPMDAADCLKAYSHALGVVLKERRS